MEWVFHLGKERPRRLAGGKSRGLDVVMVEKTPTQGRSFRLGIQLGQKNRPLVPGLILHRVNHMVVRLIIEKVTSIRRSGAVALYE